MRCGPFAVLCAFCAFSVSAQDWPQFRGPTGQGLSIESDLPTEWSTTKNIAWKIPVPGRGWSSPVIAHRRAWLTTAVTERRNVSLRLLSFDAESGRPAQNVEVFRIDNAELLNLKNSHASPTPIVDDQRVYVHFGSEGTAALTLDGAIVWSTRQRCTTQHGNGGSPVLHGDVLIFTCDGFDAAYVVALDARTGKERWKTTRRQPWSQAYATPLVITVGDASQVVSPAAHYAAAYDPATGKEIWRVRYDGGFSNVPRPVFAHGLVFIATGFNQPELIALRPDGKGDVTREIVWRLARGVPFTPSPIVAGDYLFMVNDGGILTCVVARTGAIAWQQRVPGAYSASPVLAGGHIYVASEEGVTTVFRPGAAYQRVAVNQLDSGILASIAVANRSLFIRTEDSLYRVSTSRP
jgi:outer membrane protein assembly factor BamB